MTKIGTFKQLKIIKFIIKEREWIFSEEKSVEKYIVGFLVPFVFLYEVRSDSYALAHFLG
jgi:hypothetical protein